MTATIYINGEETTWKRVKEEYGENYYRELKEEYKQAAPYTTIYSEDGMIEITK